MRLDEEEDRGAATPPAVASQPTDTRPSHCSNKRSESGSPAKPSVSSGAERSVSKRSGAYPSRAERGIACKGRLWPISDAWPGGLKGIQMERSGAERSETECPLG